MKLKYRTLILILIISGTTMKSQISWNNNHCEISDNLNSVHFFNENTGWIVGDNGAMLFKSINKWSVYPKITNEDINSVFLTGEDSGWAVGSKGTILRLENRIWHQVTSPTKATLYDVAFQDDDHGIAVGANGTILTYEEGEWTQANILTKGILYTVSTGSDFTMVSGGMEYGVVPLLMLNKDIELSPGISYNPGHIVITDLAFQTDGNAWAVGTAGALLHFNGSQWTKRQLKPKVPTLNSLSIFEKTDGIAVGYGGTILKYSGNDWIKEDSPADVTLNGSAISPNNYYAVGDNGTILSKTRYSDKNDVLSGSGSTLFKVESYPNPASEYLDILIPDKDLFNASSLSILHPDGSVILSRNIEPGLGGSTFRISTSGMNDGLFLIFIKSEDNKTAYGKFIVTNNR